MQQLTVPPIVHRALPITGLLLSLAAVAISADLTTIHYFVHVDPNFSSFCAINETINCDTVANSSWSMLWGVPISVWGLLTYALLALAHVLALASRRRTPTWPWGLLLLAGAGAVGYAAFLAFVSHFLIKAFCILCMGLYVINLALLAVAAAAYLQLGQSARALMSANLRTLRAGWIWLLALAVVGLALVVALITIYPRFYAAAISAADTPALDGSRRVYTEFISCPTDCPAEGSETPRVTIVEYTDFQCPFCRSSHEVLARAIQRHGEAIKVVQRHFPLDHACNPVVRQPFHRQACAAAMASVCAHEQDRFREFTALLWAQRGGQSDAQRLGLAAQAGLDVEAFRACLASERPMEAVMRDITSGMRLEIRGTPAFLINGRLLVGALTDQALERIIAQERQSPWQRDGVK